MKSKSLCQKSKGKHFESLRQFENRKNLKTKKQKQRKGNGEAFKEERSQRTQRHTTNRVLFFCYTIFILTDVMNGIEGFMAPCHIVQPIMFNFTLKPMLQPLWINYDSLIKCQC